MKHNCLPGIAICLFLLLASCTAEKTLIPENLPGRYSGSQKATVRFRKGLGDYVFLKAPGPVVCEVIISPGGEIEGKLGGARFEDCRVLANRGAIGRMLGLATDFKISGHLRGQIFPGDTIGKREIDVPFSQLADSLSGSIFQRKGADLFPLSGFELRRQ